MKKKLKDLVPIKGLYDVYTRSNEESKIEFKRVSLGELNLRELSDIHIRSSFYYLSICAYNCALFYSSYKLIELLTKDIN